MVPVSYLTVGCQSIVQAAAGILRIAWWKYLLAQIPGAIVQGLFYATGGFLVWKYLFVQARIYPYHALAVVLGLAAFIAAVVRYRRPQDRKSKRLNSSHMTSPYAVFRLEKKKG